MVVTTKGIIDPIIDKMPYRLALAGGWIDQPFVSRFNPEPPGSMVVIGLEPSFRFLERSGMGTSTRAAAKKLWGDRIPEEDPAVLVRKLYAAENQGKSDPSGSQDMIGLIYPGISRLDYDYRIEGGVFPAKIHTIQDEETLKWLEQVIHMIPVNQRPAGYNPLEVKNLDPEWIRRLGESGKACYQAISDRNTLDLGESLNECIRCWAALLPHTLRHSTIRIDLAAILQQYQSRYAGAMYSGCGGGYLVVISEEPLPDAIQISVRLKKEN